MLDLLGVSEGYYFALLLLSNGTVYSYGDNSKSELGLGKKTPKSTDIPQIIPKLKNVVQISSGTSHALSLDTLGRVFGWGYNNFAQVSPSLPDTVNTPYLISSLKNIVSVSASDDYSLALDSSGFVWEWGKSKSQDARPPLQHSLPDIVWTGATGSFSLALNKWGRLFWWESPANYNDDHKYPKKPDLVPFSKKILSVSAGLSHALLKAEDGLLYGLGDNYNYKLITPWVDNFYKSPIEITPAPFSSIKAFVAGGNYSAVLTNKNEVYFWGIANGVTTGKLILLRETPTLIKIPDTLYRRILFSGKNPLPSVPQEIKTAWRKIIRKQIIL